MPTQTHNSSIADQIHAARLGFQGQNGEFEPCRISLTPYLVTLEQWNNALATAQALNQLHLALSHRPEILRDMIEPLHGGGTLLNAFLPYLVATQAAAVNLCRHDFLLDQQGSWRLVESNAIAAGMGPFSEKCAEIQSSYPSNHTLEFADNPAIATQSETLFDAAQQNRNAEQPLLVFVVEANENNVFDQRYLADALRQQGAEVLFLTLTELQQQLSTQGDFLALPDGRLVDLFYFRSGYNLHDYQADGQADGQADSTDLIAFRARLEQHRVAVCPSMAAQVASSKWVQKELTALVQDESMKPWMTDFGLDRQGYLLARSALSVAYRDIDHALDPAEAEHWLIKNQNEGGGNVQAYQSGLSLKEHSHQQGWFLMQKIACQASTTSKNVFSADEILSLRDTITEVGIFCAGNDAHYAGYLARSKARTSLETGVHSGQGMVDAIAFQASGAFDV
jgi:glutathione synthase